MEMTTLRPAALQRRRDDQRYILDYLIATLGRATLFDHSARTYPSSVKLYRQVPKEMGRLGDRKRALAEAAEAAGRIETATRLYFAAAQDYHQAQHAIYRDNNRTKERLLGLVHSCYERVAAGAPYPIKRVQFEWEGATLTGLLHLLPDRRPAPTVLFIPGMDMVKEIYPNPLDNPFIERGMNVLAIDGPGQGESRLNGVHVTHDNYERAASAAVTYLMEQPEVNAEQIGVMGMSFGSYWGVRTAAFEPRIKALATVASCYGSKIPIFELASPRFKALFMYMSGISDEAQFDEMAELMTCDGLGARVTCPHLMVVGEFDQLNYLEDSLALFLELAGPREMWLMEDESHAAAGLAGLGGLDARILMADWMRDALRGALPADLDRFVRVPKSGIGPYGAPSEPPDVADVELV